LGNTISRVQKKLGWKQDELINAINAFHQVGIQVFADAVMNHMTGRRKSPI
jgi:1,4-alpha-glucan branching enzyme